MGPGSDGPMGGMGGMEPHHMNGSLGKLKKKYSGQSHTGFCLLIEVGSMEVSDWVNHIQ